MSPHLAPIGRSAPWRVLVAVGPALVGCWLGGLGIRAAGACVGVVAVAIVLPDPRIGQRWWIRLVVAGLAGLAVAWAIGARLGLAVTAGLLLSDWMLLGRPPLPGLPAGVGVRAGWSRAVRSVLSPVAFSAVAVPAVLVPWMLARVSGLDPIASGAGWIEAERSPVSSGRMWGRGHPVIARSGRWRRAGVAALGLLVVLLSLDALWWSRDPDALRPTPAAFADAPWYQEYVEDMNWVMHGSAYEPLAAVRIKDALTRYVNVVDGRRVTWSPPSCGGCRRVRVWVYGGSTTFGLGQRDEHTIPSELARAAFADGVTLDVENRGVGGDTHWEEAQRFAWDVTVAELPDMVVFYDGTNEFMASRFDQHAEVAPSVIPAEFYEEYRERVPADDGSPPPGASLPSSSSAPATAADAGRVVAERYERSRWLSRTTAESAGIMAMWIWQPTADQRPLVEGESVGPGRDWARARSRAARSALSPDVIDLSTSLEGVTTPLFYDGIHTNELGARLVAEEIYVHLRPRLRELADDGALEPTGSGG